MAGYKERVRQDLDRWIAAGHVPADKREAILSSIPDARHLDASTALAWVGGLLLGVAMIAFVSANWDAMPRLVRFAVIVLAFLGAAATGAWTARKGRPIFSNIALMLAALIFAAGVGLTGQIFDIAGEPRTAAYIAGVAAFALALAGRSTGAAVIGLVFIAMGDFAEQRWFEIVQSTDAPWMLVAAPLSVWLALRWGSATLAHVSALGVIYCFAWYAARGQSDGGTLLFLSIILGAMAAGSRWLFGQDKPFASVFYGWFTLGALLFYIPAGYIALFGEPHTEAAGIAHRIVWLAISGGLIAIGRFDRHAIVTGIGVVSMLIAISLLLTDFGLNLLSAAGVFLLCAIAAIVAGLMLRRRVKA